MRSRHIRIREDQADINITAFLNLMVVLVPFLLITAVFSQMTVLELNLPAGASNQEQSDSKQAIALELVIYSDRFQIADAQTGPLKSIPAKNSELDYAALKGYLLKIKQKFPDITTITLLLEPGTAYEKLIQTMDAVRIYNIVDPSTGERTDYELFPDISIGDAPLTVGEAS